MFTGDHTPMDNAEEVQSRKFIESVYAACPPDLSHEHRLVLKGMYTKGELLSGVAWLRRR